MKILQCYVWATLILPCRFFHHSKMIQKSHHIAVFSLVRIQSWNVQNKRLIQVRKTEKAFSNNKYFFNIFAKFKGGKNELIPSDFVILLDRSGSMSGIKIQMAVEALIFFLKSLPEGSIYNIVSFGSTFEFLHEQSL